jgi:hypothetical protein
MGKAIALLSVSHLLLTLQCRLFESRTVPHEGRFGIYLLDIKSGDVDLAWSCDERFAGLALDPTGDMFAVARRCDGDQLVN